MDVIIAARRLAHNHDGAVTLAAIPGRVIRRVRTFSAEPQNALPRFRHRPARCRKGNAQCPAPPAPPDIPPRSRSRPSRDGHCTIRPSQPPATPEEIIEVLGDAEGLARWWPSVYLDVQVVEPGRADGVGRVVDLYTKGWLPYTLRWQFRVSESNAPLGFRIEAQGDFVGRGIWSLEVERGVDQPGGPLTRVVYDWQIVAAKGVLRTLSPIMKPIFGANHRWAMARGEESLALEIRRRHASGPEARAAVPQPPGPTFPHNLRGRTRA